jgi:hypothetical protein
MSNNKDYEKDKEETLPAETTSDTPGRPTSETTTSLTKEDKHTLPAKTSSNILTKAPKKKVVVVSPSPAKRPHNDESLSARIKEAGQSFKDKITSLGKKNQSCNIREILN